ncbi:MAG: mechanosensitive ion channel family protein [Oscillospiraceae bacterium]|jgi:small-conductance mechanosensitive channel|nr:mechanosensitive ion channel family protein [Oscillospiraceae bacterium]
MIAEFFRNLPTYFEGNTPTAAVLIVRIATVAVLTFIIVASINSIFRAVRRKRTVSGKNLSYLGLLRYTLLAAVYVVAISIIVSGSAKSTFSTLIASSGFAAVVISIACQEPIGNMCSGVFIILSRPFQIGDVVRYIEQDITGTVEEITLRHTIIRTYENKRLVVPNGVMNKSVIENSTFTDGKVSFRLDFSVTYETNLEYAMELIADVVMYNTIRDGVPVPPENGDVNVTVASMGESGITLRVWVWAETVSESHKLKSDILFGVHRRFGDEGVQFAYPHMHIVTDTVKSEEVQ